jgi:hypothetical protein
MVTDAVAQTMRQIVQALPAAKIPATLMDGSAVGAWKHVRVTHDVDLLVEGTRDGFQQILTPLDAAGIHSKRDPPVLVVDEHAFIPLKYEPPDTYLDIRVDLLLAESPFQKRALSRRVRLDLPRAGVPADVLAYEDLILFKLLAGRIIDQADVAALLRINDKTLDWGYLNREAEQLGFTEDIRRLRIEAGLES